jgi:hypothetical protein
MNALRFLAEMTGVRAELDELLEGVSESALRAPGVEGEWSGADILAHFAGYTRGVADLLRDDRGAERQAPLYNAPPGLGDDDFNAIVVRFWRQRPVEELLREERDAFQALVDEVSALTDDALTAEGRFSFTRGRSLESILPGQAYRHYRDHLPAIRRAVAERA